MVHCLVGYDSFTHEINGGERHEKETGNCGKKAEDRRKGGSAKSFFGPVRERKKKGT